MKKLIFLIFALAGCASASPPPVTVSPEPVIAAERAFAADAAQRGWAASFRTYAAADAMTLSPGPVNAQQNLATFEGNGSTNLAWGPAYAGIARSGEFGFTTGPFWSRTREGVLGQYFTVWRKQPDGSWKWIFDGGTEAVGGARAAGGGPIQMLPVATTQLGSAAAAVDEVRAIETQIATGDALAIDALATRIASDAHVNRPGAPAAIGREAGLALARRWEGLGYAPPPRIEASEAGDMAFTLGEARWREAGTDKRGYYARVWQRRGQTWLIVFDEIVPSRER